MSATRHHSPPKRSRISQTAPLFAETLQYQPNGTTLSRNATISAKRYHYQPQYSNIRQTVPLSAETLQYQPYGTTISRNVTISAKRPIQSLRAGAPKRKGAAVIPLGEVNPPPPACRGSRRVRFDKIRLLKSPASSVSSSKTPTSQRHPQAFF